MTTSNAATSEHEALLLEALGEVSDPEWPVSVVDLGLVRGIAVDGRSVRVEMTFTSVGCPFVEAICADVRARLLREPDVDEVEVDVTWRRWSPGDISVRAQRQLAGWGVSL